MISPSASVIMMKPMPLARSDSTAYSAIEAMPMTSAPMNRGGMAEAVLQHVADGVGGDAKQPGMAERDQPAIAGEDVEAEREHGVVQDLAGDVEIIDARHPIGQRHQRHEGGGKTDETQAAHGTNLPNRPCGRTISTISMGRNSTK